MRYVNPKGTFDGDGSDNEQLRRRLERYRRALRRCAERSRREKNLRAAAESVSAERTRAMAAVCHDLRTPLNAILAWTQLAGAAPADGGDLREALSRIESNARSQAMLINDILDLAKSANGTLRISRDPVDLTKVVAAALAVVGPTAVSKALELKFDQPRDPVVVLGDSARLQRVVWNLLTNAVKFTPAGGRVTVELRPEGPRALLQVIDTGCGISPQLLSRIFDRFEQGNPDRGGIGLGLAIVRRLIEKHGGTVSAHSTGEGLGATLAVSLPLIHTEETLLEPTFQPREAAPAPRP